MQSEKSLRVAVIGLGVAGLAATKNLVEQGFDVTAFDKNSQIGGLWEFKEDPKQTTVLKTTLSNGSKQISPFQDFPFPDDVPDYPTAERMEQYLCDYAKHFSLERHFRLNTEILLVSPGGIVGYRSWEITLRDAAGSRTEHFDKVLVTSGPWGKPFVPNLPGMEDFMGDITHARAYKSLVGYEGKKVMVVGMASTGCDIGVGLCQSGAEVYMCHRAGVRLVTRQDPPIDHSISRRLFRYGKSLERGAPALAEYLTSKIFERKFRKAHPGYKEEWGFFPAVTSSEGAVNDHIVQMMIDGKVHNRFGIKRFTKTGVVTAASRDPKDESEVETELDAVIFATSSAFDFSLMHPDADPTNYPAPEWDRIKSNNRNLDFPRLYQTLFSLRFPHSLAFIGPCEGATFAAYCNADLSSQAIAQVWRGKYALPPQAEMDRWCESMYRQTLKRAKAGRLGRIGTDSIALDRWLNAAAGNGMDEMLGWGRKGWQFWWKERKLYKLIMDGVQTPFVYRLFDGREGGRAKWDGAREAIFRANRLAP